jgi:hypothetical protein
MKVAKEQIKAIALIYGIEYASLMAIIATETPMQGFDSKTGKLLIQFEPSWFRKKEPFAPSGAWSVNKVDIQSKEWIAFNDAFAIDPVSAMESTSIGLPQIMGFNFKQAGYGSVNEMWDDFKKGEANQIEALCRFIVNNKKLLSAVRVRSWDIVATIYNGKGFRELAKKLGREPYDITLRNNFLKYQKDEATPNV